MALGVLITAAATPGLPLPPMPPCLSVGHWMAEPLSFQSGLKEARALVNNSVVPELSERWTTTILASGRLSFKPGLRAMMAGSFHLLILPEKIPTMLARSSIRPGSGAGVGVLSPTFWVLKAIL